MKNFDLDPDNIKWCKTLHYKCIDTDCKNCKFVKLIDGKIQKNYDSFDETNICSECGGSGKLIVPKWALKDIKKDIKEDEIHECYFCNSTGLQTKNLRTSLRFEKSENE